jgi:putative toxin-antitoxin system antitoxin component (TIGR02293 family)
MRVRAPIATLDPSDVVSIDRTSDPWTKVTLTKAGLPLAGWIISADLIPVQKATVRLFDEPVGNLLQTVTGRIDILAKVATWAKVKVTPPDGSAPAVGWTEDVAAAPAPKPSDPSKPAGPAASVLGTAAAPAEDDLVLGANERYRAALLQAQSSTSIDSAALRAFTDAEAPKTSDGAAPIPRAFDLQKISDLLGGSQILESVINTELDAHTLLRRGLRRAALNSFVDKLHFIRSNEASEALGMSLRTLQRLRSEPDGLLDMQQSGRAWKFAETLVRATDVLSSQDEAEQWLRRPAMGLDQKRPIDLIATPAGARLVEDYLGRLEYDVYT